MSYFGQRNTNTSRPVWLLHQTRYRTLQLDVSDGGIFSFISVLDIVIDSTYCGYGSSDI